MLDLNEVQPARSGERIDIDAVVARLRGSAEIWVPQYFPNGRRDGDDWRLANIKGAPPRKNGSCVIALKGERAGDWHDFDGDEGGGPLSTLGHGTGLSGYDLLVLAATESGDELPMSPSRTKGFRQSSEDVGREIARILVGAAPISGSLAERYLAARGLKAPHVPDLLFHDDLTHWETKRGFPGIVAIVRDAHGSQIALHRTYLDPEKPTKADISPARKTLGPVGGGSVHLAEPGDGLIALSEGIETALAVMTACPELPVWATLSASGMEGIVLPPDIARVLLLADHDDAGRRAAEAAAATLAMEGRQVGVALPPREGDDFNDLLLREGPEAIRATIDRSKVRSESGSPPGQIEMDAVVGSSAPEHEEVARTAAIYPLPIIEGIDLHYFRTRRGDVLVHRNAGKDRNGHTMWRAVASPFGVTARLRYLDQEDAYGLRMLIRDMQGAPRAVDFARAGLARQGAQDIRSALFAAGLRTYGDGDQIALTVLKAADPKDEILVVSRPGWHRLTGSDHPVFVTPAGRAIGDAAALMLELAANSKYDTLRGSLDGWKTASAAATSVKGCPHFLLGVLAGFSGVVQSLAGLDSCGLNLSGLSSSGKTTAQRLSVSAWTSTAIGAGLLQSMRSTENAIEVFAQAASGTVLALDELAHADGRSIARLIYAIAGGQGKARMTPGAILKQRYAWSTYALLSSECSLEEKVRADGAAWIAGMAVRILDVDVTDVDRSVSAATLRAIGEVENHCGHAGPAFVERLVAAGLHHTPDTLRDRILEQARELVGTRSDSARLRAATCLALPLIAGRLAQDFNLLPWSVDIEAPVRWAWERFEKSSDAEALTPDEQAVASLRAWIAERWDVTIKSVDIGFESYDRKLNNREAVAWYDDATIYVPAQRLREAAGETLKTQQIVKALADRDLLATRQDQRRATVRWVPKIGRIDAYALKRSEFGRRSSWTDDASQDDEQ
jgi:hypothetical protein